MSSKSVQRHAFALAVALSGCATRHGSLAPVVPAGTSPVVCAPESALPNELLDRGSVVLFGETHGVQELPQFFGEVACATAASGMTVEVGLEIPKDQQSRFDAYLGSAGGPAAVEALIASKFWAGEPQDGRPSLARVELIERLRQLRGAGLPIGVFLFDLEPGQDAALRDKTMADNIAGCVRAHPEALTMILVGDVHAWKAAGAPWDPKFLPMGWHLADAGLRVCSLGRATPAGTAWNCLGTSMADMTCGPVEARATPGLPSGRAAGIELLPQPSTRGYDGLYATPSLTSSPPAKSSKG